MCDVTLVMVAPRVAVVLVMEADVLEERKGLVLPTSEVDKVIEVLLFTLQVVPEAVKLLGII